MERSAQVGTLRTAFLFFGCGFVHAHSLIAKRFQYVLFLAAKLMYPRQHVEFYDSVKTKRTRLAV